MAKSTENLKRELKGKAPAPQPAEPGKGEQNGKGA